MVEFLPLTHLLRVQLFFGALLLALPWLALTKARPLLANLFDLRPKDTFFAVLTALALSWSLMLSGYVVLRHLERFGSDLFGFRGVGPGWPVAAVFVLGVLPTVIGVQRRNPNQWTSGHVIMTTGAVIVGGAFGYLAVEAANWGIPLIQPVTSVPDNTAVWLGYADHGKLSAAHIFAACCFVAAAVVYTVLMFVPRPSVPTLAYVYTWLSILCWALAATAFFLDKFMVPLSITVLFVLLLSGYVLRNKTDHYFRTVRCLKNHPPAPGEVLDSHPGEPVIVVAANGGGIQSAAWTARVLAGLDSRWRQHYPGDGERFRRRIRLISGVSGGSVGAMNYLETWNGTPADQAVRNAQSSSLADVAWGLVYPDFLALLMLVLPRHVDRGNALEWAWTRTIGDSVLKPLSSWYDRVLLGQCPAVVYNATITETGERLLMGTTSITQRHGDGRRNLSEVLHGCDVATVTAARLSATFPFVTPVARPDDKNERAYHLADGGYYDNYGTVTAVEWLDEALRTATRTPERVLLLEIHGAPAADQSRGSSRGWAYQFVGPITCILIVRSAGQLANKIL
ncbi:MAG TPA: patatin-like phospholipase family protein [Bryobacteraceae bacterium]|nr:patatin-like phospholipase family protein [Bryobacteraceae bacterium]